MLYYATKLLLSAAIVVVVSEAAKVNAGLGALMALRYAIAVPLLARIGISI